MRKKRLIYSALSSLICELITVISGFVLPRLIIQYYGSDVNGLVASITQFLGFITFLELGIGAVVKSSLYEPLAKKDNVQISRVLKSAQNFFKKIALVLSVYTCFLTVLFPIIINNSFDFLFTASLIIIISISSFAQYYFGITNKLLLNADQKAYIPLNISAICLVINTACSVLLILNGASIHVVKLTTSIIYTVKPLMFYAYVKRHYKIDYNIQLIEEPIKQKWNGLAQHIAYVVLNNTDIVVLTAFSTLASVSVYTVYSNVAAGILQIISSISVGVAALIGNVLYSESLKVLQDTFSKVEWFFHTISTLLYTITGILIIPFVQVYTSGVTDANYIEPTFAYILILANAARAIRSPYDSVIQAAGHYRQTQNSAFTEAIVNIIISIVLVHRFGLIGVAIGTFVALTYRTIYFVCYLKKYILNYRASVFALRIATNIVQVFLCVFACRYIQFNNVSWMGWILYSIQISLTCTIIIALFNIAFYRNEIKYFVSKFFRHNL